jgi:predicted MFS family arabinose efflux permease
MKAPQWKITAAATALTALIAGSRTSFGLFLSPINTSTGLGMASISLAAAVGQLAAGFALPFVGALARRHGTGRVIAVGACLLAASTALVGLANGLLALVFLMLVVQAAGTAVASNALLLGEVNRRAPVAERGLASGIVGAGGPAGQLLFAPVVTVLIARQGWMPALWGIAALALFALPLSLSFKQRARDLKAAPAAQQAGDALRDRRFWLIAASFGICGFHVAFLSIHMPGVIEQCGLSTAFAGVWLALAGAANMAGSIGIGVLMRRQASAPLLMAIYALRAVAIALFLLVPPSPAALLAFAVGMGASYMAALPPTAELLTRGFGVQRLSALLGVIMLVHQVGGFAGAWLGGIAVEHTGGYAPLWLADMVLALVAAALQWPLRPAALPAAPSAASRGRPACAAAPARPSA